MTSTSDYHEAVLLPETMRALRIRPEGVYIDFTAGGGSHSAAILAELRASGRLIAGDRDLAAVKETSARLQAIRTDAAHEVRHASFSMLAADLMREGVRADGVLADLGVSSHQLDTPDRGYSYRQDGPLDMRMDRRQTITAAIIVNQYSEAALAGLFRRYGEERYAKRIAASLVQRRAVKPFERTVDLAETVAEAMPPASRKEAQHPARRVFQALRIEVNGELRELESLLESIPALMAENGRVLIITFHSIEDRLVKHTMQNWQNPCRCPRHLPCTCGLKPLGSVVEKGGLTAQSTELKQNRRAKSARLRVFEMRRVH